MDAAAQVKARVPLEDVVAETVSLKPAGHGRLVGLCPFHSEKTPSFHVVTDKGFYHCFGCQASGDLFTFVQETQGLAFYEALEQLAARAGITLPERSPHEARRRDLYEVTNLAQAFFQAALVAHAPAQDYLSGRGFSAETVAAWGLGYAPDGWHGLVDYARTQGVVGETLCEAGLAKSKDGRTFDFFRGRVTIPIRDLYGRIVGFTARTLGDEQPKYLNTPETPIFHKGDLLFGLDQAKATIRDRRAAILVEGHLDVIALHQAGFTAAVGAQSATLTEAQIHALARLELTTLYMALDADDAGQRATLAGCDAVARRFVVKVARLPHKDPAETVQKDPELFRKALREAVPETRFRIAHACEGVDLSKSQAQRAVLTKLKRAMLGTGPLDPVAAEIREEVCRKLELAPQRLNAWLGGAHSAPPPSQKVTRTTQNELIKALRVNIAALVLTHETQLEASCMRLRQVLPAGDPLVEFAHCCAEAAYDPKTIWGRLPEWPHVAGALKLLVHGVKAPLTRFKGDLERYIKLLGVTESACTVTPDVPPQPTEQPSSPDIPGYGALKAYALEQKDNLVCLKLLETFGQADSGDTVALADLHRYLQNPQVQQLLGLGDTA